MTEEELLSNIKMLTKDKEFKKKYGLKLFKLEEIEDTPLMGELNLYFRTKNFIWSVYVEYRVNDAKERKIVGNLYNVEYEIDRSSFDTLEDYFCRDDVNYTWEATDNITSRGETPDEIALNLVEDIIGQFDEPDMVKRYKDLTAVVKKMEKLNKDDLWVVGMIADVI